MKEVLASIENKLSKDIFDTLTSMEDALDKLVSFLNHEMEQEKALSIKSEKLQMLTNSLVKYLEEFNEIGGDYAENSEEAIRYLNFVDKYEELIRNVKAYEGT